MYMKPEVRQKSNRRMEIRLTDFEHKLIKHMADERGLTVSAYCRMIIIDQGLEYSLERAKKISESRS